MLHCIKNLIIYVCGAVETKGANMIATHKEVQFVTLKGEQIPLTLNELTHRSSGIMEGWRIHRREVITAAAIMHGDKYVGWSACIKEEDDIYSVCTFIAQDYRQKGLGQMALIRLLVLIKEESPSAFIKCGYSRYEQFDLTYERTILAFGLRKAGIFTRNELIKQAA